MEIKLSGPFFDHPLRAHESAELAVHAREAVGQQALADWHENLNKNIRHPTPYYETQLVLQEREGAAVAHDRGVIYGPWLEGVGSRNKSTRFKGYFSLRRAAQSTRGKIEHVVRPVVERYLARMGGTP